MTFVVVFVPVGMGIDHDLVLVLPGRMGVKKSMELAHSHLDLFEKKLSCERVMRKNYPG